MEEFLQSTTAHTQYLAERCQLDQSALVGPGAKPGTNEAVEVILICDFWSMKRSLVRRHDDFKGEQAPVGDKEKAVSAGR